MAETSLFITYSFLFTALFFEVFLLVSFLEKRARKTAISDPPAMDSWPRVAIAVPCFNEEKTVGATLSSLLSLSYPNDKLEIIVVDDGSTDNTFDIAQKFTNDTRVRVFRKENGGKHTAMNFALGKTDAELIGCLDADTTADPSALSELVCAFQDTRVAAVTPAIHVRQPRTFLEHIQNSEYRLAVFNRFVFSALGSAFITPGPFSIFRTSIVRSLGGWKHGHSTEDLEMALRIQSEGHLIANAPRASVHTGVPETLHTLFHQRVRWTYGLLRNAVDYRSMFGNRAYGNLGLFFLPIALVSIASALYFFTQILWHAAETIAEAYARAQVSSALLTPSFDIFFINTSAMLFIVYVIIVLIVALMCAGSLISTGRIFPPASTPLFLVFYGFLAPFWLGAGVVRAVLKTGVRWK